MNQKMCFSSKASISSWWILALMSLFLWYRNERYDRALSVFVFTLGLIQLIEYGIHSGTDPNQSGRALFITLWLQCLVLAIGVFLFIDGSYNAENPSTTETIVHTISGWNLFLFAIIFVVGMIMSFTSDWIFSATPGPSGHIEWYMNGGSLLGKWGWLYLIGLFVPMFLIFAYYAWADVGIAILILYGILSAMYVISNYPSNAFSSMWCYLSIGFAFLAYFLGIIPPCDDGTRRCV
jgi:hypothetical protein